MFILRQAPEILDGSHYDTSVDVYSYALTIFECLSGSMLERRRQVQQQSLDAVCDHRGGWRPKLGKAHRESHPLVWALIQECWRSADVSQLSDADTPKKRPNFVEIVKRLESMRVCISRAPSE